jgi:hypothetical protein
MTVHALTFSPISASASVAEAGPPIASELLSHTLQQAYGLDLDAAYEAAIDDPTVDLMITGDVMDGWVAAQFDFPDRLDGLTIGVMLEDDQIHPGGYVDEERAAQKPAAVETVPPLCDTMPIIPSATAAFYICDSQHTSTVGIPLPDGTPLQDVIDALATVPTPAHDLRTVFDRVTPPTAIADGDTITLDFDDTLHNVAGAMRQTSQMLDQLLTTIWVNTDAQTVRLSLNGDCDAASHALETIPCMLYDRSELTDTLLKAEETDQ